MPALSILICGHGSPWAFERQLAELRFSLRDRPIDYEVLLVGSDSSHELAKSAESIAPRFRPIAASGDRSDMASLVRTGLAASSGETIAFLEYGNRDVCRFVPALVDRLARADFVQGKRQRRGLHKLSHRVARIPQWLVLGLDIRDPGCRFWAARREALEEIAIHNNVLRYLGPLVAQNGFRVDEISVPYTSSDDVAADQPINAGSLLAAWREKRRLKAEQNSQPALTVASEVLAMPEAPPASALFPVKRRKSA